MFDDMASINLLFLVYYILAWKSGMIRITNLFHLHYFDYNDVKPWSFRK